MMNLFSRTIALAAVVLSLCPIVVLAATEDPDIIDRGQNHRTWRRSVVSTNQETGRTETRLSEYVELGDGLHYWDEEWKESRDLIEIVGDNAVAQYGPHKVVFAANANTDGAIDLLTSTGNRMRSHVLGLFYFDAESGRSALIGQIKDSVGELVPPNQLVYKDAISGVKADIQYIYTKGGLEQNVVLLERPAAPEAYGLNSATTRLEVWTAFVETPEPQKRVHVLRSETDAAKRARMVEPDLVDEILAFGGAVFPVGRTFLTATNSLPPGTAAEIRVPDFSGGDLPVAKRWHTIDGTKVLVEALEWRELEPKLRDLRAASPDQNTESQVTNQRTLLARMPTELSEKSVQLAAASYSPAGVVIDYILLSSSTASQTFTSGTTYYIETSFSITASATFQAGSVIKYADNAYLWINGASMSFPSTGAAVVFTSKDDNVYGDPLPVSTANPTYHANAALSVYYVATGQTIQNARFRWAKKAVDVVGTYNVIHTVLNCQFDQSDIGVVVNVAGSGGKVDLTNIKHCGVNTPISLVSGLYYATNVKNDCGVVNASNNSVHQAEPAIAVNPVNPLQVVIVAMWSTAPHAQDMLQMVSNDGGATWTRTTLPKPGMDVPRDDSDPSIAFDIWGNLFLAYRSVDGITTKVSLYVSTDAGNNWSPVPGFNGSGAAGSAPVVATGPQLLNQKSSVWVTMDKQNAGLFCVGTEVSGLGSISSTTWTSQTPLPNSANLTHSIFSSLAFGPGGEVFVAHIIGSGASKEEAPVTVYTALDPDGVGASTFGSKASFQLNLGWEDIKANGDLDVPPIPTVAWDRTRDIIYIASQDKMNLTDETDDNLDIYIRYSLNRGSNWHNNARIPIVDNVGAVNTTATQFHPRLAVNQGTGKVAVIWYDCRKDASNEKAYLFAAVSQDRFATTPRNFQVNPSESIWLVGATYKEYVGLTYVNGFFYPAWLHNSVGTSNFEIHTAKIPF